jgi:hypothetical protein
MLSDYSLILYGFDENFFCRNMFLLLFQIKQKCLVDADPIDGDACPAEGTLWGAKDNNEASLAYTMVLGTYEQGLGLILVKSIIADIAVAL